jgi:hypothetical protein
MKYDPKGYAKMLDTQAELLVAMFEGMTAYEFEHSPKEVWEEMLKIPVGKMFGTMYVEEARKYIARNFKRVAHPANQPGENLTEILHKRDIDRLETEALNAKEF